MPTLPDIRSAARTDLAAIKTIAVEAKMFTEDEVGVFDEMFEGYADGSQADDHWLVLEAADGAVAAAAYYAPQPFADRMWNLYFLAVSPRHQGAGRGRALIEHVEHALRALGEDNARTLIVETSSTEQYAATREFYRGCGFDEEARIREFYGPTDHKIVFWKSLLTVQS